MPEKPSGPVLDQANILPQPVESRLDARLRELWATTADAVVVVSVTSLDGASIETFATKLFNSWGIGDRDTDRGVLLLVAPNERRVRIEVGCGAEPLISDEIAGQIIQQQILPAYRSGDFAAGTLSGVDAVIARLALPQPANDPGPHSDACRAEVRDAA